MGGIRYEVPVVYGIVAEKDRESAQFKSIYREFRVCLFCGDRLGGALGMQVQYRRNRLLGGTGNESAVAFSELLIALGAVRLWNSSGHGWG